jgi:hypothetical protein
MNEYGSKLQEANTNLEKQLLFSHLFRENLEKQLAEAKLTIEQMQKHN